MQLHNQSLAKRFRDYRRNAATRSLAFELTREQFAELTERPCSYCGTTEHVGVDRIDSSLGYIMTNVQPACSVCNLMKSRFGEDMFLQQIARIARHRRL